MFSCFRIPFVSGVRTAFGALALWFSLTWLTGCSKEAPARPKAVATDWSLFVPVESAGAECAMHPDTVETPSKTPGLRMYSLTKARYAVSRDTTGIRVQQGERYRLSAWAKAGDDLTAEPGSPGLVLRGTLFSGENANARGGHLYIGTAGVARKDATKLFGKEMPREWMKIEAVIEIPEGVALLKLYAFCWYTQGTMHIADLRLEKVSPEIPATPLL